MDDPLIIGIVSFVILIMLVFSGLWIAMALALVGLGGFLIWVGDTTLVGMIPAQRMNNFILTAVPLFIFMGQILVQSGISDGLYRGAGRWLAWVPGGLLHANIGSCAMFAAISGSSIATAATIGTVALPALKQRGYDAKLSYGSLAAGGTLGILIPPSLLMIYYGYLANVSVGRLFAGGMIPGIILTTMFLIYIAIRVIKNPRLAPKEEAFSARGLILGLKEVWPVLMLVVIILGGIFSGFMTPTEAAAIGSVASLALAGAFRRLSWHMVKGALLGAVEVTCMVLLIVMSAMILTAFFAMMRVPGALASVIATSELPPLAILLLIYLLYVFLGCFLDATSQIILTIPIVLPLLESMGVDTVWFGVILTILIEVGLLTPPMGSNLFVIMAISGERNINQVILGSIPFWLIMFLSIALFTVFPSIILWLPNIFFGS